MNAEQTEQFRKDILGVLDANRTRYGLGIVTIAYHLIPLGFTAKIFGGADKLHAALADELQYLTDKGFVEEAGKQISRENRAWRLTESGFRFVDCGA
jgi:hypothetical protein